jgi:cytochrome c-type biogenesis protein CcmH
MSPRRQPALTLLAALLVGFLGAPPAEAIVFETRKFETPEQEQRYRQLTAELRCLVCQNQNIADSEAELAGDLRRETHEMILAGSSDEEIVDFMVSRYGDFVLYRPPIKTTTVLLWVGPFVLGVAGLWFLFRQLAARRRQSFAGELDEDERRRLAEAVERES